MPIPVSISVPLTGISYCIPGQPSPAYGCVPEPWPPIPPIPLNITTLQTDVFYVDAASNHLMWDSQVNGIVTQTDLGGVVTATPAAAVAADGSVQLIVEGTANRIYQATIASGAFEGYTTFHPDGLIGYGASLASDPTNGNLYLFVAGTNSQLYMTSSTDNGLTWSNWLHLGGILYSAPSAEYDGTTIVVFVAGSNCNIWMNIGGTWSPSGAGPQ